MKNKDFNKESMYNWLIALVIAIVAVVLSVAAVLLSVYLPGNNMIVASAAVGVVNVDSTYVFDETDADLSGQSAQTRKLSGFTFTFYVYDSQNSLITTSTPTAVYYTKSSTTATFSWAIDSDSYDITLSNLNGSSNSVICHFPSVNYNRSDGYSFYVTINSKNTSANNYQYANTCLKAVLSEASLPVTSSAPIFGADVLVTNNFAYYESLTTSEVGSVPLYQSMLYTYEITNASDFEATYLDESGVKFDIKYYIFDGATSYNHVDSVLLRPSDDGKYYISLASYSSEPLPPTKWIYKYELSFFGESDTLEISNNVSVGTQSINQNFVLNYWSLTDMPGIANNGYADGYRAGVDTQVNTNNNLTTLVWEVFQLPFRLLFGTYDDNALSETYGQYVGGLFQFTILGLDVRAFVLGLLSLVIIIGIFKFIMGTFGGLGK